jgi:uncharacterized membrane protein YedE/YeeE
MEITPFQETKTSESNTDFEVRTLDSMCINESRTEHPGWHNLKYLAAGIFFGIVLVKGEIISWFRIQAMFRLQQFHMYGVIGSALTVAMVSVWLIRKFRIKSVYGETIEFHPKRFSWGQVYGGLLFGLGWSLTGACPGPLFAQIGAGFSVVIVTLASAVAGTWVYGRIREKLPH